MDATTAAHSDCLQSATASSTPAVANQEPHTGTYRIWYMAPEINAVTVAFKVSEHDLGSNALQLTKELVPHTHRCIMIVHNVPYIVNEHEALDELYNWFQAENWSPNGEARPLIEALHLQHTSMSVGDVIEHVETNRFWLVADFGFTEILQ